MKQTGLGDRLLVDGVNLSGDIGAIDTITSTREEIETTHIDKPARERRLGLRDGTIEFTSYFNDTPSTGAHPNLKTLPRADRVLTYCRGFGAGSVAASMVAKQIGYDGERDDKGAFTLKVAARANGYGLDWGVQHTDGLRTDTAPTNGATVDRTATTTGGLGAYLHVLAFAGTSCTVKLQESADGDIWADVTGGSFGAQTAPGASRIATSTALTVKRYLRVVTTGSFSSCAFVVTVVRGADVGYTLTRQSAPDRTEVTDTGTSALLATFTDGARTVSLTGPQRTFTEAKPPITDSFARTKSSSWGTSPTGGTWGNFGGVDADFSVSSSLGRISINTANVSRYVRLNNEMSSFDARMKFTLSTAPAVAANSVSLVGGWQSTSNHYRYRLTFGTTGAVTAAITSNVSAVETNLSGNTTVGSGFVANQQWWIRGVFDGATLSMYAWKDGDAEPVTPTTTAADATFPTGRLALRGFTSTGATNSPELRVVSYSGTGVWPAPPTVTHATWVRLLDAEFDGEVDEAWLGTALGDTSDDLLAVAMDYITDGALDASYGPLNAAGGRDEGADFNDYLGITQTYPASAEASDAPEVAELGCLDCSGYVRIVFGYRGERGTTLPLSRTVTGSGFLPRTSVLQLDDGPGVAVVARNGTDVPGLTKLLPGDIVGFDATADDDEAEGQPDHDGIYLGVDTLGDYRFLSSRKTPDGPTFADLGGNSTLNGAGTYASSFRVIRRF